ncbi:AraC family transcriptional regulator [Colwellia sp. 4_MG-2023]|uniref:AraC family transcriptional regulator n=1 Tax=unclassified Colwellia TaxID=196834 RepID=UPI001C0918B1|nr:MULTISPECIES: AraC family transcriptional regulator [unclassified Colwellia]MBU2923613.1 AraC family transcriptional regulator [Colwellia sp. C2M11]MDO6486179.1 AraC family transcriptional regulator [Colwellia sp. 6_MG-2023]MDO6505865.1 AraC family transcriptional regulator [Colwellia sp. 5_MG-2023]MDO6554546.1 AraC family transcriptional regulator [Colwellia sp. 4_MG-2023]MDO6652288.1 AraC family transcriptional regulator [Colwellia sp. 3_MG-2023]
MKNLLSIRSYSTKPTLHSHSFHQLVLPLRGVINISVGNFSGKVAPSECVVVKANEEHLFTADSEARFVVVDMESLPFNISSSQCLVFTINTSLRSYLTFIENQLENTVNAQLEQAMFELFSLLLAEQALLPKVDNRIGMAISFIENNIADHLKIKRLAESAFLSETQFKKIFKQQTGMSVMKYVTKLRMEKAQALLTHTDYPLHIIGEKIGYKEPSTFSRKFSQYFGLSPTKFKK